MSGAGRRCEHKAHRAQAHQQQQAAASSQQSPHVHAERDQVGAKGLEDADEAVGAEVRLAGDEHALMMMTMMMAVRGGGDGGDDDDA